VRNKFFDSWLLKSDHHRNEYGSLYRRAGVSKITAIIIHFICASVHSPFLFTFSTLKSRIVHVLDLSVSRQPVGTAMLATGLARHGARRRSLTTCSHAHAQASSCFSYQMIESFRKTNPCVPVVIRETGNSTAASYVTRGFAPRCTRLFWLHGMKSLTIAVAAIASGADWIAASL